MKTIEHSRRPANRLGTVRARRAEQTRADILKAGLKVFADKGFDRATIDDIAAELRATKGLVYYHFKTKEEILSAILADRGLVEEIEKRLDAPAGMPLAAALESAVKESLKLLESYRELIRFIHVQSILSLREAEVVYREIFERLYARVADGIEFFKALGEVRIEVSSRHWARMMVDLVTTYFLSGQVFGARAGRDPQYLDHIIRTIVMGIGTEKAIAQMSPAVSQIPETIAGTRKADIAGARPADLSPAGAKIDEERS